MSFLLTCAICAAPLALPASSGDQARLSLDEPLMARQLDMLATADPIPLALWRASDPGSGGGDGDSSHMTAMWIGMGVLMVAVMVGMGVYLMRHGGAAQALPPLRSPSPAQLALPVAVIPGGG